MMKHPLLALAFCVLALPSYAQAPDKGKGKPPSVVVAAVQTLPFYDTVEGLGTLRANESVDLTATVTKTVTSIHFKDGQRVQGGTVLVEMNRSQEKAQLAQGMASLAEARRQLARIEPLAKEGAASEALLDQRQHEYETAKARLAELQSLLREYVIIAPFSGVLGLRNVSVGALVRPGDTVATIDDDSMMKLDFSVPSLYLTTIKKGLPVEAKAREFGDKTFSGSIESFDSRIDPVTRSFVVRAMIPNKDHSLRPGLLMTVVLQTNPRESMVVPENSIVSEGYKNFVFVVDGNTAKKTEVQVGTRRPGQVEITGGLTADAKVVTHGTMNARDGQPVFVLATEKGDTPLKDILENAPASAAGKEPVKVQPQQKKAAK